MAAWILPLITTVGGFLAEGIKGFFGVKTAQSANISQAIGVINQANLSAAEREKAVAAVIAAEAGSGYWLSAVWRPLFMVTLVCIMVAYVFGYTTPELINTLPEGSFLGQLFELLKIGVMGYMPLRTVDKAIEAVTRANVINKIIDGISKK